MGGGVHRASGHSWEYHEPVLPLSFYVLLSHPLVCGVHTLLESSAGALSVGGLGNTARESLDGFTHRCLSRAFQSIVEMSHHNRRFRPTESRHQDGPWPLDPAPVEPRRGRVTIFRRSGSLRGEGAAPTWRMCLRGWDKRGILNRRVCEGEPLARRGGVTEMEVET